MTTKQSMGWPARVLLMCAVGFLAFVPGNATSCPEGATEPTCPSTPSDLEVAPVDPGIQSKGQCRGACGADCPSTCEMQTGVIRKIEDPTRQCCIHCQYTGIIKCGTHAGCREHDDCYDGCAGSSSPLRCRRGCDLIAAFLYGVPRSASWALGYGPYDGYLYFSYGQDPAKSGPWPTPCP